MSWQNNWKCCVLHFFHNFNSSTKEKEQLFKSCFVTHYFHHLPPTLLECQFSSDFQCLLIFHLGHKTPDNPPCQQIPDDVLDVLVITTWRAQLREKAFFWGIFFFYCRWFMAWGENAFPSREVVWMQLLHCSVRFCQQGDQRDSWNEEV